MARCIFPYIKGKERLKELVADCYRIKYSLPLTAVDASAENPRKQYGIDITVQQKYGEVCIVCRNKRLVTTEYVEQIIKMCTFFSRKIFKKLVIVTLAMKNPEIDNYIVELHRRKKLKYEIEYISWDKMCDVIEHLPKVYCKYYGKIKYYDYLREVFFETLRNYDVPVFLELDPLKSPINSKLSAKTYEFITLIRKELEKYMGRDDEVYEKIEEFNNGLEKYTVDLAAILSDRNGRDLSQTYRHINDSKFEKDAEMVRKSLKNLRRIWERIIYLDCETTGWVKE